VSVSSHRYEIELRLKAELDEAERQWRDARRWEREEARRRFSIALHDFTRLVLYDQLPAELPFALGASRR
jgi:hypothetical protein